MMLSIIVPALRCDTELRRCIDSIYLALGEFSDAEVILVAPSHQVNSMREQFLNVVVYPESHPSIYAAMNDGVRHSQGKYLYFIGKDDILLPTIRDVVNLLDHDSPDLLCCDVYYGDQGVYSGEPSRIRLLTRNLCHQGIVYSRTTFENYGPYLRRMKIQADHLLNIKILWDNGKARSIYLPKPLAWFSAMGTSARRHDPLFWSLYPMILRKYVGWWAAILVRSSRFFRHLFRPNELQHRAESEGK